MPGGYRTAKLKGRNGIEVSCEVRGTINPDVMQEIRCNLLNKFFEEVSRREGYDRHMALVEAQKDKERRSKRWANWFWWLK